MNDERAWRCDLAWARGALLQEVQIGILVATAVQPDIERAWLAEVVVRRNYEAVWLRRRVDRRAIAFDNRSCRGRPRRLTLGEQIEPLVGFVERPIGLGKILLDVELTVQQREL